MASVDWLETDTPSGNGHLLRKASGETIPVRYSLRARQRMTRETTESAPIHDLIDVSGKITPLDDASGFILRSIGKHFALCLEDNRKLDIVVTNSDGTIAATGANGFYRDDI